MIALWFPTIHEDGERRLDLALDLVDPFMDEGDDETGRAPRGSGAQRTDLGDSSAGVDRAPDDEVAALAVDELVEVGTVGIADREMIEVPRPTPVGAAAELISATAILL